MVDFQKEVMLLKMEKNLQEHPGMKQLISSFRQSSELWLSQSCWNEQIKAILTLPITVREYK